MEAVVAALGVLITTGLAAFALALVVLALRFPPREHPMLDGPEGPIIEGGEFV